MTATHFALKFNAKNAKGPKAQRSPARTAQAIACRLISRVGGMSRNMWFKPTCYLALAGFLGT